MISILVAFALTEILSSWGRIVEARDRVVRPSLSAAASGWLFLSLIIHWLDVSAYRNLEFDRNYESLLFFLPSICWPMLCATHMQRTSCTVTSRRLMCCLISTAFPI